MKLGIEFWSCLIIANLETTEWVAVCFTIMAMLFMVVAFFELIQEK